MAEELFTGTVKAGRFVPDDPPRFAGRLARLEGRRVRASFRREQTGRTMSQNKYLWGVVYASLSEWCGHDVEELHEHLKTEFLSREQHELPSGTRLSFHPSTRNLTVEQFSEYVDRVVRWAAEQGVRVPEANEVTDA